MINILIFLKEVLDLLNEIYIYIYVKGHVAEWAPSHTQSVRGLKEKRFKLQELGKKGLSCGICSIL